MKHADSMVAFYQRVMRLLVENGIEFLVGGGYAFGHYTGLERDTKDIDLMVRPSNVDAVIRICRTAGYESGYAFSHWLAKVKSPEGLVDIVFRAGNGLCEVTDDWLVAAPRALVFGYPVRLIPPEEMIWQKAYIMERERFDGADVAHLLFSCGEKISWKKLVFLFGPDWRVLLSHLVLFGFIYPAKRNLVPRNVLSELITRFISEEQGGTSGEAICNGTLFSRVQYRYDLMVRGFRDARLQGRCRISPAELTAWDNASPETS
jgi:hypothetical protein